MTSKQIDEWASNRIEIKELKKKLSIAVAALEFYSKGGSMKIEPIKILNMDDITNIPFQTLTLATKTAREALKQILA